MQTSHATRPVLRRGAIACSVAMLCVMASAAFGAKTWSGGSGNWSTGGNWSPSGVPGSGDEVVIDQAGANVVLDSATTIASLTITNTATLTFTNWSTKLTVSGDVRVKSGANVTVPLAFTNNAMSNRVWIACSNLTVELNGRIDVDSKGYAGVTDAVLGHGPGAGSNYAGGSHGGYGGGGNGNWYWPAGLIYDVTEAPVAPGSAGGSLYGSSGAGGGAVRIEADVGTVTVEGTITANGGAGNYAGGGAGGSIYITCKTFQGTAGAVRAKGGQASGGAGYGGGGGRIAIVYDTTAENGVATPFGVEFNTAGARGDTGNSDLGTLYFPDSRLLTNVVTKLSGQWTAPGLTSWNVSDLTISNCWIRFPTNGFRLTVTNNVRVIGTGLPLSAGLGLGGAGVADSSKRIPYTDGAGPALFVGGNLELTNGGMLHVYAGITNAGAPAYGALVSVAGDLSVSTNSWIYPYSQITNGGSVRLSARNATIYGGGGINADGKGYRGITTLSPLNGFGPGRGTAAYAGGGYGGIGGGAGGGAVNGSSNAPAGPGSSGAGDGNGTVSDNGGGSIWLRVSDTLRLYGTLTANGSAECIAWAGGGSGGGIYLDAATLVGTSNAVLSAVGSTIPAGNGGGGGGGRIAVWFRQDLSPSMVTTNVGGGAGSSGNGAVGTVVWATLTPVRRVWTGTTGYWDSETSWEPVGVPHDWDDVAITNAGASVVLSDPVSVASLTISNATLVFTNWSTKLTASSNVTVQAGGIITLPAAYTNGMSNRVWIACDSLTVEAGGKIDADAKGWGRPSGAGAYWGWGPGASYRDASAGHGGCGAAGRYGYPGNVYDSVTNPVQPGSSSGGAYGSVGGAGGGVIRVEAIGVVTVDGTITAKGEDMTLGCAGAGGSVYVACNTIRGSGGVVSAAGGGCTATYASGGGGRIAVHYSPGAQAAVSPVPTVRFDAGTKSGVGGFGDLGTLYFPDNYFLSTTITGLSGQWMVPGFTNWSVASLTISNACIRFPTNNFSLTVTNDLTIIGTGNVPSAGLGLGGGEQYLKWLLPKAFSAGSGPELRVGGTVTLTNGALLAVYAGVTNVGVTHGALVDVGGLLSVATNCWVYPHSQPTNGGCVRFLVDSLRVDAGGGFNANEKGYAGKLDPAARGSGPGAGYSYAGGSFGGTGGYSTAGTLTSTWPPYGNSNAPVQCGSSGGANDVNVGGNGGGLIWIRAAKTAELNGTLSANGELGYYYNGAGSGGGINLRCTTLIGSSSSRLLANGGSIDVSSLSGIGGGGGGGRIAVWRVNESPAGLQSIVTNTVDPGVNGTLNNQAATAGTIVWGTLSSNWVTIAWTAGAGTWESAGNWTEGFVPRVTDAAAITNTGANVVLSSPISVGSLTVSNATLVFTNWSTKLTVSSNVIVQAGGIITLPAAFTNGLSNRVWIACNNLTVESGGKIDADAKGWGRPAGVGAYSGWGPGASFRDASAGHGGNGAAWPYGYPGTVYDSVTNPVEPGSSSGGAYGSVGGAGGGVIWVEAAGMVTVDGMITAKGEDMTLGSGGAGGSVYVACTTVRGSGGVVSAAGGGCTATYNSGGGGRIAVHYSPGAQAAVSPVPSVRFDAGTKSGVGGFGDLGTLYFPDNYFLSSTITGLSGQWMVPGFTQWGVGSLLISNSWIRFPTNTFALTVTNDLTIVGTGNVPTAGLGLGGDQLYTKSFLAMPYSSSAGPVLRVGGAVTLTNGGLLAVYAGVTNGGPAYGALVNVGSELRVATNCWVYPYSQPTNGGSVYFSVDGLRLDAGGGFDANAKGYAGKATATGRGNGPGAGYVYGGGSYGGTGGFNTSGQITSTWPPYGNANAPVQCGSSGGSDGVNMGGCGGGLIWIKAAKSVILNGTLTANGELGFYYSPAGSGGGIDLRCTTLSGAASTCLLANGGGIHAASAAGPGGGGGGGRIAVWRVHESPAGLQSIVSNAVNPGANGTITTLPTAGSIVWGWVNLGSEFKMR